MRSTQTINSPICQHWDLTWIYWRTQVKVTAIIMLLHIKNNKCLHAKYYKKLPALKKNDRAAYIPISWDSLKHVYDITRNNSTEVEQCNGCDGLRQITVWRKTSSLHLIVRCWTEKVCKSPAEVSLSKTLNSCQLLGVALYLALNLQCAK